VKQKYFLNKEQPGTLYFSSQGGTYWYHKKFQRQLNFILDYALFTLKIAMQNVLHFQQEQANK